MSSPAQRLMEKKAKGLVPLKGMSVYPLQGPAPQTLKGVPAPPMTTHLFRAQQGKCFHCAEPMSRGAYTKKERPLGWTREHVIPQAKGGNDHFNIVLAHNECNRVRGDDDLPLSELSRARTIILAAHIVRRREGWPDIRSPARGALSPVSKRKAGGGI